MEGAREQHQGVAALVVDECRDARRRRGRPVTGQREVSAGGAGAARKPRTRVGGPRLRQLGQLGADAQARRRGQTGARQTHRTATRRCPARTSTWADGRWHCRAGARRCLLNTFAVATSARTRRATGGGGTCGRVPTVAAVGALAGETNLDRRARRRARADVDRPAVQGEHLATDGQPEAAAAGVPGAGLVEPEEPLEDALVLLGWNARAGVPHLQLHDRRCPRPVRPAPRRSPPPGPIRSHGCSARRWRRRCR